MRKSRYSRRGGSERVDKTDKALSRLTNLKCQVTESVGKLTSRGKGDSDGAEHPARQKSTQNRGRKKLFRGRFKEKRCVSMPEIRISLLELSAGSEENNDIQRNPVFLYSKRGRNCRHIVQHSLLSYDPIILNELFHLIMYHDFFV
jgi:hypothetical protein